MLWFAMSLIQYVVGYPPPLLGGGFPSVRRTDGRANNLHIISPKSGKIALRRNCGGYHWGVPGVPILRTASISVFG